MFLTYLTRELRRRRRQASLVAIGLAIGVGLVITVGAASSGVSKAQGQVLHSLYGVGTDLTVTKPPSFGSGGAFHFGFPAGGATPGAGAARPSTTAGQRISVGAGLGTLPAKDAKAVAGLRGVQGVVGSLSLSSFAFTGQFQPGSGAAAGSGTSRPSFSANIFSIEGVDIEAPSVGPLSGAKVTSGHYFTSSDRDAAVALVDSAYAKQKGLKVGSTTTIKTTSFKVVGVVSAPSGGTQADLYIPLQRAQQVGGEKGGYTTLYVQASSNSVIPAVKSEINKRLPSLTVTTAADLASQVSGSLGTASTLSSSLGTWLAVIVLLVAFALAAMLTLSSVSNRVREFGTLKALGWHTRRIVGQIVAEGLVQGAVGAALGVGLGFLGAFLVARLGGTVHAAVGATTKSSFPATRTPGGTGGGGFGGFGGAAHRFGNALGSSAHTVLLHLTAPVAVATIGLAIALALAGGLLAGVLGGWRVARLRPAEALRRLE